MWVWTECFEAWNTSELKTTKISGQSKDKMNATAGMMRHKGRARLGRGSEKIPTLPLCHRKIRGYDSMISVSFLLYDSMRVIMQKRNVLHSKS